MVYCSLMGFRGKFCACQMGVLFQVSKDKRSLAPKKVSFSLSGQMALTDAIKPCPIFSLCVFETKQAFELTFLFPKKPSFFFHYDSVRSYFNNTDQPPFACHKKSFIPLWLDTQPEQLHATFFCFYHSFLYKYTQCICYIT